MRSVKAIFASKLYKSSNRKDHIKAQLQDPMNSELIQQLRSYLDEDYQKPEYVEPDYDEPAPVAEAPSETERTTSETSDTAPAVVHSTPAAPAFTNTGSNGKFDPPDLDRPENNEPVDDNRPADVPKSDDVPEVTEPEASAKVQEQPAPKEDASQSTKVKVTSSIQLMHDLNSEIEHIKGTLNANSDTAGVNRILLKDQELWVYYNDDINLNNVMGPAIELLNASGFTYLSFNRLARSDNAIVFEVHLVSTRVIQPASAL